ncbi:MAG TPA: hypothetical protein VLG40_02140 [Candidatus Saccharimonas sp.]|nr:hypothetical protein [Candidatus Saccharimonas sp.]
MDRRRLVMACAIITVLALGVVAVVVMSMTRNSPNGQTPATSITLSGNLACLPFNTNPGTAHTDECAIGFKTDDGRYYSLQQLPQTDAMTLFTKHVTVSGTVVPPTDDRYTIRGTITVTRFTVQQ